jgi:DNA ligase-1
MKPLLAHVYEPHRVTYPCYVQPKLNGIRALYQNGRFQSRDQIPFPSGLLDHLSKSLSKTFDPSIILDGELYVHGWPLQRINAAVTPVRQNPTEDTVEVGYCIFDVVNYQQPFYTRFTTFPVVQYWETPHKEPWGFVQTARVETQQSADTFYAKWVGQGYEGMMYRLGDCPYTVPKQAIPFGTRLGQTKSKFLSDKDNRAWHLLKRKDWQDDEFEWGAIFEGEGRLKGMLGSFGCVTKSGRAFQVGSGLSDAERIHYWNNPPNGKKIKVKYLVLSEAGAPLNPTILAIL